MAIYQGSQIITGGISPFQIAKQNGFTGTEEEFNAMLAKINEVITEEDLNATLESIPTITIREW